MSPVPQSPLLTHQQVEQELAARTELVDGLAATAFAETLGQSFSSKIGIVAVGGFGRRELFPHSDIDILILHGEEAGPDLREPVGRFVQRLWDAGLRLSHSVRTVDECCHLQEGNTEFSISLLDRRFLAGDAELWRQMEAGLPRFFRIHGSALARQLARLTRNRHKQFQDTIYHLEPNIKETPGGLRDLHVVHWLEKLHPGVPSSDDLRARDFLFPLRMHLHRRARRDDNVLSFDVQEEISGQPAEMMRNYFRHAREVYRLALALVEQSEESERSLLGQFRDWRARLSNADFTLARERVFVRSPQRLAHDPELIFELFEFVARHGVKLAPSTEKKVSEVASGGFKAEWPRIEKILSQPHAAMAVRAMEDCGVLAALIPEWRRIECLVVRDFYHRYTVDEHTLVAIESLERLDEDRRFAELFSEIERPSLLRLALLLHDIGKGTGNHVAEGLLLVRSITARLGLKPADRDTVLFLVEQHLALSSVMTSRDLEDPLTARTLAGITGTVERLKLLALLTYADISAVNPTAMSPWRRDRLWRAYRAAYQELTRELATERVVPAPGEHAAFVEGFPARYIRTHSADEIASHAQLLEKSAASGFAFEVSRIEGYYALVVAAADRKFLFASISGALAAFGMNILKAEAYANRSGFVLDTFTFADPLRSLELNPTELHRLEATLARVLSGKDDVRQLIRNRRRTARRGRFVPPSVTFNNEVSPASTLIEIVAEDRPGLLYDLSSAMSQAGLNIEVVLIDTEAHKALDVFYVSPKLSDEVQARLQGVLASACSN